MASSAQSTRASLTAVAVTAATLPSSLSTLPLSCYDQLLSPELTNSVASCVDNKIVNFQPLTKPFKLLAYNPSKLIVGSVEACGQEFHIKEGGACTYCPDQVGGFCPPGKETVLLPGAGMV